MFLSKSLTKTEADYSNIEREMLAILFACERLYLYIFGREASADWKPGIIESRDQHPDSYWLINTENDHRIRRNKHNIKPRYPPRLTQPHAKQTVH